MRYKLLGKSGLRVSELCLGTMTFGEDWGWGSSPDSDARKAAIVRAVVGLARECGHSPAQVALAWLRQRATPVIPIIGARKLAQVKDNLACVDIRLEPAFLQRLDAVSRIELGFPHDMFAKERPRSLSFGGMRDLIDAR